MEPVFRQTYNLWVRPGTSDDFICDEAKDYERLFVDVKNYDVLLDIGANIGAVSNLAKDINPHLTIIAYEPEIENYNMLVKNVDDFYNISVVNAAIGSGEGMVELKVDNGSFKAKHSVKNREFKNGHKTAIVKKYDFRSEILKNNATLLKIDIEGGEYDLDFKDIPKQVKGIAIEIHLIDNNYYAMLDLYRELLDQFPFQLGDRPKDNVQYLREHYKEKDSSFMTIFLRNEI